MKQLLAVCAALCAAAPLLMSQESRATRVGALPDGRVMLDTGWILQPAGKQIPLSTFPMSAAVAPGGKHLVVLQGGAKKPSLTVFALPAMTQVSTYELDDAWLGLHFAPGNSGLFYVSGGSRSCVYELHLSPQGVIEPRRTFSLVKQEDRKPADFVGDVAMSPDGRLIYVAALHRDAIWVINPQSGRVIEQWKSARRPYRILFHPDGRSFYVTGWADGSLYRHDALNGAIVSRTPLGAAPMDMLWSAAPVDVGESPSGEQQTDPYKRRLYVALANSNTVAVLGDPGDGKLTPAGRLSVGLAALSPAGMTPSALALTPDGKRLYVVCADANAVAVVDVSTSPAVVEGFIPVGEYPTAAQTLSDGSLLVLNGHGGSASHVPAMDARSLALSSGQVLRNSPLHDWNPYLDRRVPDRHVVPNAPGSPSPIKRVIYIVTDALAADLARDTNVTPNRHALAREFVALDNFHALGGVAADGINWSVASIAPPYVQRLWPNSYGGRRAAYDYEGTERATMPPAGYLWNNALAAGLSFRNYGWWSENVNPAPQAGPQIATLLDPVLKPHTSMTFRAPDPEYLDTDRAKAFIAELKDYEKTSALPAFIMMRLGGGSAERTSAKRTPAARAADTDLALGMIVDAVSKSKFWGETAIFVLEAGARGGATGADASRSQAFIASPYTRHRGADATLYNTVSMLHTIELITGLRPMTIHDAGALPMFAAFGPAADKAPFDHIAARRAIDEVK